MLRANTGEILVFMNSDKSLHYDNHPLFAMGLTADFLLSRIKDANFWENCVVTIDALQTIRVWFSERNLLIDVCNVSMLVDLHEPITAHGLILKATYYSKPFGSYSDFYEEDDQFMLVRYLEDGVVHGKRIEDFLHRFQFGLDANKKSHSLKDKIIHVAKRIYDRFFR